jgi:lipopolysaccharide assembly outer membrane protein LptD (OstA)
VLQGELFYADANQNMNQFPLYDPLDDDSIEHFRRRFYFNTFNGVPGGNIPLKFDERYYALRSGLQSWVTSPSTEIADTLAMGRVSLNQRWQTKRGLPGQQRIVDWIVFDVNAALYPNANRDNFGSKVGLIDYDFRWHLGDRLTLLSDGFADVFGTGLKSASLGGYISRPEYGSAYLGVRTIDGPVQSQVLSATVNYRMTEKWIATGGMSYDFGQTGNIGQLINLTRVGESFLVRLGFNVDYSRGNVGAIIAIEPRFLPNSRLGLVGGIPLPPVGAMGLE